MRPASRPATVYRCAACGALNRASGSGGCFQCRRPLDTTGQPQPVDSAALVAAIRSSPAPVLVDFEGPGARFPALDGVARDRAGALVVLRVDPRAEPAAAEAFDIRATPTLVLFVGGAEIARRAAPASSDVSAWLEVAAGGR